MKIRPELIEELLKDYKSPEDILGEGGLLKQLTKAVLERCLQGELTHPLGSGKHDPIGKNSGNSRNGSYEKTVIGEQGEMLVKVPRDRKGSSQESFGKKRYGWQWRTSCRRRKWGVGCRWPEQTIRNWAKAHKEGKRGGIGKGQRELTALELENHQLKRERAQVKMERDILKKAAAYFAKESLPGTR
ncbi:MAG: transposase [Nitrospirales bacterium]|nr:transposase [Nitrospirales bacterium]